MPDLIRVYKEKMGTILMIGGQEIILVVIVALVLFGADKIPELARGVGKGMREFKKVSDDLLKEIDVNTKDIRKDLNDITDSVRKNLDNITTSVMTEVDDAKATVQQKMDEVTKDATVVSNNFQQTWNNEVPENFNDSSEERINDMYNYDPAPYDYREDPNYAEPVIPQPVPEASVTPTVEQAPVVSEPPADEVKNV